MMVVESGREPGLYVNSGDAHAQLVDGWSSDFRLSGVECCRARTAFCLLRGRVQDA